MLAYCANVHPVNGVNDVIRIAGRHARQIRRETGWPRLGVGLFLPAQAARWLARRPGTCTELNEALEASGLECTTINGFPYTAFHAESVKQKVYQPGWTDAKRREHTERIARALARMLPEGGTGSISTVPLGWQPDFVEVAAREEAAHELAKLAADLHSIRKDTGRTIRVGLEPEPYTALETTEDVLSFFTDVMADVGPDVVSSRLDCDRGEAKRILKRHIGVCLDACHLAVMFERPAESLVAFQEAGIAVVKVQLSSALRVHSKEGVRRLAAFAEDRYLHQTVVQSKGGHIDRFADLPEAMNDLAARTEKFVARTHFHLPIDWAGDSEIGTTQDELVELIAKLAELHGQGQFSGDIETETYTWGVMPEELRPTSLAAGIGAELRWAAARFAEAGWDIAETAA